MRKYRKFIVWTGIGVFAFYVYWMAGGRIPIGIKVQKQGIDFVRNPIHVAIEKEVPIDTFKAIIKENSNSINALEIDISPLSYCVLEERTNYAHILLANGADLGEAKRFFSKDPPESSSKAFLQYLEKEMRLRDVLVVPKTAVSP
jgi:hypothetical protein